MFVVIFIIILAILVFVHELGHFLVAKKSGIRVDEFGLGFPPRLLQKKVGETVYSLNLIPFGGFVKIFGENPDEESTNGYDALRSFVNKPKHLQAAVLVAGIVFNLIFAWLLISASYMIGSPQGLTERNARWVENPQLTITSVMQGTPAEKSGIRAGSVILEVQAGEEKLESSQLNPETFRSFITSHEGEEMTLAFKRNEATGIATVTPVLGVVDATTAGIGVSMDQVGVMKLPAHRALIEGAIGTWNLIDLTARGIGQFLWQTVTGQAKLEQVTGPVGIAGLVGEAQELGFTYLMLFTAFISINLALLNLLPFPALDGGRLLFVAIEAVKGSPINPRVANTLNTVGFALLLLLMAVVTFKDILRIVS